MRRGRYYLGRVVKLGHLDHDRLVEAFKSPQAISVGQFQWMFTDTVDHIGSDQGFIFSQLSKYSHEGKVTVVDTDHKSQKEVSEKNLLVASSPFIYLPDFSGIAYLHVWNGIEEDVFRRRFSSLVEAVYDRLFVSCEIKPISDYRAFEAKLRELDIITEIRARVRPPNPLFGDLWKSLNNYIKERNASEVLVSEKSLKEEGLKSKITELVNAIVEKHLHDIAQPASLTDAALLMAADGYGSGKVSGEVESKPVTIRTADTQKSFLFDKDPDPQRLADEVRAQLESVNTERDMKH